MPVESEHTRPSEWCPRPELWEAPDGWATETEVSWLLATIVRATKPLLAVETGTYLGDTTLFLAAELASNGVGRLVGFEIDPDRAQTARGRCAGLPVDIFVADVRQWIPPQEPPIGFAFIDSDPAGRPGEIEHLWPYLAPGAIVAVHDTAPHHAPDLARLTRGRPAINLRTPRGLLVLQKE